MNMKLGLGAALLSASLLVGGAASATTVVTCQLTDVVTSTACIGALPKPANAGSPSASDIAGLGGFSDWEFLDKIDNETPTSLLFTITDDDGTATGLGEQTGDWSILNPEVGKTYALAFKGATFFAAYVVSGFSGTWSMEAITNKGGQTPDLSNASLFSRDTDGGATGEIPLPAGMPLMLAGLGAFAFLARRKARKA